MDNVTQDYCVNYSGAYNLPFYLFFIKGPQREREYIASQGERQVNVWNTFTNETPVIIT